MTGWAASVYVCGVLAMACLVWLIITTTVLIRQNTPRKAWESAAALAKLNPELVAEIVDTPAVLDHVVSIDTLPHAVLVEKVLTAEQREIELVERIEDVRTDAVAVIADVMIQRDLEHAEAVRQERLKGRYLKAMNRLKKGNA